MKLNNSPSVQSVDSLPVATSDANFFSLLFLKISLDVTLSLLGLFALAPLLLLIALVIRIDSSGPIMFRQVRTGRNGQKFSIYKFRTMTVQDNGTVVQQATRGDKRVTRVGQLLRKTSLDELPQLINVVRGEMSLVGPRPHALAHDEYYRREIPVYHHRFAVKPGLTGWAQVSGSRGETPTVADMQRRVDLDLWYIENRTLALDLVILARTVQAEISRKTNAY